MSGGQHPNADDHAMSDTSLIKDTTIATLVPNDISECALYLGKKPGESCLSAEAAAAIGTSLGLTGDANVIMAGAKTRLECESERCVLGKLSPQLGAKLTTGEINIHLKISGPTDSQLLNNIHIDHTLQQWRRRFTHFYPYNFNMRNYASFSYKDGYVLPYPDTLATISFADLYYGKLDGHKYTCCACVINTDTYQGEGKHWMALFADARAAASSDDAAAGWSAEFFNSSGNAPAPEWVNWLEKTKNIMEDISEKETAARSKRMTRRTSAGESARPVTLMKVTSIRHQQSKSECGIYSLFYIWARLNGIPAAYFSVNPIPDRLMFEFRQHLFDDPTRRAVKQFRWDEYKNTVDIEWEK